MFSVTEVAIQPFYFLDPSHLCKASQVCRKWQELLQDERLWKSCYQHYFKPYLGTGWEDSSLLTWKEKCKHIYRLFLDKPLPLPKKAEIPPKSPFYLLSDKHLLTRQEIRNIETGDHLQDITQIVPIIYQESIRGYCRNIIPEITYQGSTVVIFNIHTISVSDLSSDHILVNTRSIPDGAWECVIINPTNLVVSGQGRLRSWNLETLKPRWEQDHQREHGGWLFGLQTFVFTIQTKGNWLDAGYRGYLWDAETGELLDTSPPFFWVNRYLDKIKVFENAAVLGSQKTGGIIFFKTHARGLFMHTLQPCTQKFRGAIWDVAIHTYYVAAGMHQSQNQPEVKLWDSETQLLLHHVQWETTASLTFCWPVLIEQKEGWVHLKDLFTHKCEQEFFVQDPYKNKLSSIQVRNGKLFGRLVDHLDYGGLLFSVDR